MELKDEERQPCEVWTRVMGYFRPVGHFNIGKKSEFKDRVWFDEAKITPLLDTSHQSNSQKSA